MQAGRVTIAIPTMNRADLLRLSVASAVAQTYEDVEIIVSNNASTDHTATVLAEFSSNPRIRVIKQDIALSMVENWNQCVSEGSGEFFLLLSDDDLLEPEAVSEMVRHFKESPVGEANTGIVYCRGRVIDAAGCQTCEGPSAPISEDAVSIVVAFFKGLRQTWPCTILFRRSDIMDGYSSAFRLATDAAQWMRATIRHGNAVFVDRILANYRVHDNVSLATPIATWQEENRLLAEFAIRELQANGIGTEKDYAAIRKAVKRYNVVIVPPLLARSCGGKKLALLKAYISHWRNFASLFGLDCAARGLITFYAPGFVKFVGRARRQLA